MNYRRFRLGSIQTSIVSKEAAAAQPSTAPITASSNVWLSFPYRYYLAAVVALIVAAVYVWLIVRIDNTNLATTNGLSKAPTIAFWEKGTGRPIDDGEMLYLPAYGYLSRLIPDAFVHWGTYGSFVLFRKMALLNAVFGAFASAVVFLMACRFTGSVAAGLIVSAVHASAGFVLLNSLNSEDIMPGYSFFLAGTACLFEYILAENALWIVAGSSCLAIAMLFHWSLLGPGLIALGLIELLLAVKNKRQVWILVLSGAVFLMTVEAFLLCGHKLTLLDALYPGKLNTTAGWLGFHREKLFYAAIGIGNYFSGAQNFSSYDAAFRSPRVLTEMMTSWVYCLVTLGASAWALWDKHADGRVKLLAVFAWALFLSGELADLYSQPQDPQFQIQPMFATIAGLIIIMWYLMRRLPGTLVRVAGAVILAIGLLNGYSNVRLMEATTGADSQALRVTRQLEQLFPPNNTVIVWHAFEGWTTWRYILTFHGDGARYSKGYRDLAGVFTGHPGISGDAAAALTKKKLDAVLASGNRLVAHALWTQSRSAFVGSLTTLTNASTAGVYYDQLRYAYDLGEVWQTEAGAFVQLLPKKQPVSAVIREGRTNRGLSRIAPGSGDTKVSLPPSRA